MSLQQRPERDIRDRVHAGVILLENERGFLSSREIVDYTLAFVKRELEDQIVDVCPQVCTPHQMERADELDQFSQRL